MNTFRERFDTVFGSGVFRLESKKNKVERLAQLIYANDRNKDKEDCLVQALEEYELMTGGYYDPTREEYEDILASIV